MMIGCSADLFPSSADLFPCSTDLFPCSTDLFPCSAAQGICRIVRRNINGLDASTRCLKGQKSGFSRYFPVEQGNDSQRRSA